MALKEAIIEARNKEPSLTMQDIATPLDTTRQYVSLVLREAGLPTMAIKGYCRHCSKPLSNTYRTYCSSECHYNHHHIRVQCDYCGELFIRRKCEVEVRASRGYKLAFCSKRCHGKWLGREYGFVVHPENIGGGNGRERKWDYDYVAKLREQPLSYKAIKLITGIPFPTIYQILHRMGLTKKRIRQVEEKVGEKPVEKVTEKPVEKVKEEERCPKCNSTLLHPNEDGDLQCMCGKIIYAKMPEPAVLKKKEGKRHPYIINRSETKRCEQPTHHKPVIEKSPEIREALRIRNKERAKLHEVTQGLAITTPAGEG